MSNAHRERGFLSLTIDGAKEYFQTIPSIENRRRSQPVTLCGAKWDLKAFGTIRQGTPYLGVYIYRSDTDQAALPWSFKVTAVMRVCRPGGRDDKVRQFSHTLSNTSSSWGYDNVLEMENLAAHCDYFNAQFYGELDQRNDDEIKFDDMDPDDFATFLKVLVLSRTVDEGNVAAIMPLANYFGARIVVERCEEIIVNKMDFRDAILVLDKCGISDLKEQLFSEVLEEELEEVASSEMRAQLSAETKDLIIEEFLRRRKETS